MTVHTTHPFPEGAPDPMRRARGRLGSPVTLWACGSGRERIGATVSSTQFLRPAHLLGVLDPLSTLATALEDVRRWTVGVLGVQQVALAEAFGGMAPQPGGPFRAGNWRETEWGPIEQTIGTWCGVEWEEARPLGESLLVIGRVTHLALGDDEPLLHWRGRFGTWASLGS